MRRGRVKKKDAALFLNSIVKGLRGLGSLTEAAATGLPVTAVASASS